MTRAAVTMGEQEHREATWVVDCSREKLWIDKLYSVLPMTEGICDEVVRILIPSPCTVHNILNLSCCDVSSLKP
jgi:hypothetical protein